MQYTSNAESSFESLLRLLFAVLSNHHFLHTTAMLFYQMAAWYLFDNNCNHNSKLSCFWWHYCVSNLNPVCFAKSFLVQIVGIVCKQTTGSDLDLKVNIFSSTICIYWLGLSQNNLVVLNILCLHFFYHFKDQQF